MLILLAQNKYKVLAGLERYLSFKFVLAQSLCRYDCLTLKIMAL